MKGLTSKKRKKAYYENLYDYAARTKPEVLQQNETLSNRLRDIKLQRKQSNYKRVCMLSVKSTVKRISKQAIKQ